MCQLPQIQHFKNQMNSHCVSPLPLASLFLSLRCVGTRNRRAGNVNDEHWDQEELWAAREFRQEGSPATHQDPSGADTHWQLP